jgi:hypothetical protein
LAAAVSGVIKALYGGLAHGVELLLQFHPGVCAEHVRQLEGESPFHNLMEVK